MPKFKNVFAKRNYRGKKPPVVFSFARNVGAYLLKNAITFIKPTVLLIDLTAKINKTEVLYNIHLHGTPVDTMNFDAAMADLFDSLDLEAEYVDEVAQGDGTIVVLSGFDSTTTSYTRRKKDEVYTNSAKGEVTSVLTATPEATGYCWQYHYADSVDVNLWILANCTRKAFFTYTGLTSYKSCFFRHAAIVNNELTEFSEPHEMAIT